MLPLLKGKIGKGGDTNGKESVEEEEEEIYGILEERNIQQVQFGLDKLFPTWYGSAVYFDKETRQLGIYSSKNDNNFKNINKIKIINGDDNVDNHLFIKKINK